MSKKEEYMVKMQNITKSFGSYTVLKDVNLNVRKGSIHALLGQNGAGKTTLMNILYGLQQADSGNVYIDGKKVNIRNAGNALRLGIGMVHQHFMLIDNFTVAENIILGSENTKAFGIIDDKATRERIQSIVDTYNLKVDLGAKVDNITVGMQQKVEIIKLLYKGADILILDEPTAILSPAEVNEFLNIVKNLADKGKTIIFITHKLKEAKQIADKCTILRKGEVVSTLNVKDTSLEKITDLVTGGKIKFTGEITSEPGDRIVFKTRNLCVENDAGVLKVNNLNLRVHERETVGIIGIDGNGQTELTEAIIGLKKCTKGRITVNNKEIQNKNPRYIRRNGVSMVHEDRFKRGLIQTFSVEENAIIEKYRTSEFAKLGVIDKHKKTEFAKKVIRKYKIEPEGCSGLLASDLSGGNQQKLIVARELENDSDVIVVSQPTKGMDINSRSFIHELLFKERNKGKAILLISYSVDEVMAISDVIYVMYNGQLIASFTRDEFDRKTIEKYMSGGVSNADVS